MMRDILVGVLLGLLGVVWGLWRGARAARIAAQAAHGAAQANALARAENLRSEVENDLAQQTDLVGLAHHTGLVRGGADSAKRLHED